MHTQRLALVRSANGPWIPTKGLKRPHLKITGLAQAVVNVRQKTELGSCLHEFNEDGTYELTPALWSKVSCEPACKTVICIITSGPVE